MADFLYYDRKGDEDLPVGAIEEAIGSEIIPIDEIVEKFRQDLEDNIIILEK